MLNIAILLNIYFSINEFNVLINKNANSKSAQYIASK